MNGRRFGAEPGISVIRYRDGSLRWHTQVRVDGVSQRAYHDTIEAARAWLATMLDEQAKAKARRSEAVTELVDMAEITGYSDTKRRELFGAPLDADPLFPLGSELADALGRPLTLDEIGDLYGVTRERIRQVEAQALHKLRRGRGMDGYR